jgi:glycosyltransferase involved in cell wall biosynthesis
VPLRVLIDYRPALGERSGVGEYVHQLAGALTGGPRIPKEIEVTLFSSSWKQRYDPRRLPGVAAIDLRIPVQLLNLLWHRFEWPPVELLARRRFDVVHSPHPLLLPSRDAAQVVTIHDLDFLEHPERTRAEIRRDYPILARRHAERAHAVIVPSRHTAGQVERLLGLPAERISICPHGAPNWAPRPSWPDPGYILFVGTLEPRKNVGGLLRAYELLLGLLPETPNLVLAGSATVAAQPWLEAISRPPLAGRVRWVGYLSPERRQATYAGACLLVQPSFEEGFGLTVLEAMSVGVPVVAARRGALPEVLGDAGLLADPENAEELANAMARLLRDVDLARAAATSGLRRASAFTWDRAAAAAIDAYERAVRRHLES